MERLISKIILSLIGRPEIRQKRSDMNDFVKDKTILVTGGAGSIGSDIVKLLNELDTKQIIVVDRWENGIFQLQQDVKSDKVIYKVTDILQDQIVEIFQQYRPQIVFHAAAYKHVPLMEENEIDAYQNNVYGTARIAGLSELYGCQNFVLISTDKAVNPTNIMGSTKRIAEYLVTTRTDTICKFSAVRFGNVLESNGSLIPIWQKQIDNNKPITVTHKDAKRYFMTIREATELVLISASIANNGDLFLLDMGEPVSIYELARKITKNIEIIGLRKGEKLFEELSYNPEFMKRTQHEMIFKVEEHYDDIVYAILPIESIKQVYGSVRKYLISLGFNICES